MHHRLRRLILVASLFASACATANTVPLSVVPTPSTREAPVASTATAVAVAPTRASTTAPVASPTTRPTEPPEPTATPQPEPDWHWAIHPETGQVVAVNPLGENRPVGDPHPEFLTSALTFRLDPERALVLVDDGSAVRAYLLTIDALEPITLPANLPYNHVTKAARLQVVGYFGDYVAVSYETFSGSAGDNGTIDPQHGPLVAINLAARTAELIDPDVNVVNFDDPRAWVRRSNDGRYLRFLAGTHTASRIRELDLATGAVRTIHDLTGKVDPFVRSSRDGSAWLIENEGVLLDVTTGAVTPQDTQTLRLQPLGPNLLLAEQRDCAQPCVLQLRTADGQVLGGKYQAPWGVVGPLTLLLPGRLDDGALIVATRLLNDVANDPAITGQYPELDPMDRAVFRLNPDGTSEVLGLLPDGAISAGSAMPFSDDGRYATLLAPDRSALRLFDLVAKRLLAEITVDPSLENPTYEAQYFETGVLVEYDGDTFDNTLQRFVYRYRSADDSVSGFSEAEPSYTICNDLLADGSVLCWHYPDWNDLDVQFVRYEPDGSAATPLLEGFTLLELVP